ncbi:MAG: 3-dehydroquinate synthase [Candidatus Methanofastidiosum methylothiophilum]|uniref:3-dehydroquinate synthase n=1 Tax=Candidatus Methanofastidiosum methylothiophilum TaxID=1705564 RepID=A0A150IP06_9EURY|nr:MAG: 3-dehydroquinate synthase [Candidatus Methanofastidiosum methylthiophilus]KYC46781.1 MAG: 3-dehydroquinate synthase [Candidatus Methanofastidiosum methylthiophilus]KYC49208.1 MAG: 3-dehydroquinate synthase [Candidatus Methanofastidiosum methylthiophilus]
MSNSEKEIINVKTGRSHYEIIIGRNIIDNAFEEVLHDYKDYTIVIITDSNVQRIYENNIIQKLNNKEGVYILSFKAGEESKNRKTKEFLEDRLFELGLGRDTLIIALGGGVTGDLAGFIAATYMRGVPFIQIPTTLLSQVDSSIGGKVGIDHPTGKNLLGAFYPPNKVYIDIDFLKTLPNEEIINGIAEIIKAAIIQDSELFRYLESNIDRVINLEKGYIEKAIISSLKVKAKVVESDEKESGLRKILNFGHTIGHSIEVLSNFELSHGRAVGIGMAVETIIAQKIGILKNEEKERIFRILNKSKLLDKPFKGSADEIIKKTSLDKKSRKGIAEYSLIKGIGFAVYGIKVEEEIVRDSLVEMGFL